MATRAFSPGFGAALSVADFGSDVVVILQLLQQARRGSANALIATICTNLIAQSLVAIQTNKRKGRLVQLRELLLLFSMLSPGVHAYRVVTGATPTALDIVTPQQTMLISKVCEVAFEAVPGLLIQFAIILSSSQLPSHSQLISVALSTATIAFNSVMIFHGMDQNPHFRSGDPTFYGALPDGALRRALCLSCLMVFTMCHVFMRCLGLVLLSITFGLSVAGGFWAADFVAFLLFKAARCDAVWFTPTNSRGSTMAVALVGRLAEKIMVDFTGCIQVRHSYEIGGMLFSLTLLWSLLASIGCAVLYQRYYLRSPMEVEGESSSGRGSGSSNDEGVIRAKDLYTLVGALASAWLVSFVAFINLIKPEYISTFFRNQTGSQYMIERFRVGDDLQKARTFLYQKRIWAPIANEVSAWTHQNWKRWKETTPDWFTAQLIEKIPDEFIPEEELHELNRKERGARQKSNVAVILAQSSKVAPR